MDKIFHSLVGTYCFHNDEYLTLEGNESDLSSTSGYTAEEVSQKFQNRLMWMILPEDRPHVFRSISEQLLLGDEIEISFRIRHKNGRAVLTTNKIRHIVTEDQQDLFYGVMMDVSKTKERQVHMDKSMEQYQIILSQTENVTFELDMTTDTITFSDRWNDLFGYTPKTHHFIATLPANSHIHPADIPGLLQSLNAMKNGASYRTMDIRISTGGQFVWFCLRASAVYDANGKLQKIVGIFLNIDDEKKEASALQAQAECDSLTQLLNKATMQRQTEGYLNSFPNGAYCALLIIDLDNFKQVNDRYGHMFGDKVLLKTADSIRHSFRSRDLVARIGGDEFMVLMKDISNEALVKERCEQLLNSFHNFSFEENSEYEISCSIGVALSPHHATTYEKLFKLADEAMYTAKKKGKNNYSIYQPEGIYYY